MMNGIEESIYECYDRKIFITEILYVTTNKPAMKLLRVKETKRDKAERKRV